MLIIETELRQSSIEGLGLFAKKFIPKGAIIWRFDKNFDRRFNSEEVEALDSLRKRFFDHYCYKSPQTGLYIFLVDNYRFLNHASIPNVVADKIDESGEVIDVAARDILEGEELTYDYGYFSEQP